MSWHIFSPVSRWPTEDSATRRRVAAGLCGLGDRRRKALSQSAVSCANLRHAVRLSLSELSSRVPAGPPCAPRGRLSCLLPQTQRRRVRSAISVTASHQYWSATADEVIPALIRRRYSLFPSSLSLSPRVTSPG